MDPDGSTMKSLLASLNRYRYSSPLTSAGVREECCFLPLHMVRPQKDLSFMILTSTGPFVWVEEPPSCVCPWKVQVLLLWHQHSFDLFSEVVLKKSLHHPSGCAAESHQSPSFHHSLSGRFAPEPTWTPASSLRNRTRECTNLDRKHRRVCAGTQELVASLLQRMWLHKVEPH